MRLADVHRRVTAALGLAALAGFIAGAGASPSPLIAAAALVLAFFWRPSREVSARLEPVWRIAAVILAVRAFYHVLVIPQDVVLPMVDLLLLLLCAEALRRRDASGDARLHSLCFALLVASAAYRPGLGFAIAFLAYIALATVALLLGHIRRQTETRRLRNVTVRTRFLFQTAALSAIVLVVSGAVFVAFPRVSRSWVSRGMSAPKAIVGFADRVSLGDHGARIEANPEVVLRVEFPDGPPANASALYWRGRSYDHFDGVRWGRSSPYGFAPSREERSWPGGTLEQRIYGVPLETPVLFGVHPIMQVRSRSRIQPLRDGHGDWSYLGVADPVYSVTSRRGGPDPGQLRASPRGLPPGGAIYLQMPRLDERIAALADSITSAAEDDYDRVRAVERWLRTNFSYTLDLPRTAREATLDNFLFRRRAGHCEYFSTAMAVMVRTLGIPTRNVNGFLGGEWNAFGSYLTVTQNQAHSWVEVWFPAAGWVPFDPTPPASAAAVAGSGAGLSRFRFLMDGFEHRWNKWVLDYDLERQFELVRGAADAFSGPATRTAAARREFALTRALLIAGLVIAVAFALRRLSFPAARLAPEAGPYIALRSAYERMGVVPPNLPPLAFRDALERQAAPGHRDAEGAVALYVQARFGGRVLNEEERSALRAHARAARSQLRRAYGRFAALRRRRAGLA